MVRWSTREQRRRDPRTDRQDRQIRPPARARGSHDGGTSLARRSEHLTDESQLLWTDPQEQTGRGPSKRGVGLGFGPDVTKRWCELNKVTAVIRSHEVRADGYAVEHDGLCITVFSCPNYCDNVGNKGISSSRRRNKADRVSQLRIYGCKPTERYRITNSTLCHIPISNRWHTALALGDLGFEEGQMIMRGSWV